MKGQGDVYHLVALYSAQFLELSRCLVSTQFITEGCPSFPGRVRGETRVLGEGHPGKTLGLQRRFWGAVLGGTYGQDAWAVLYPLGRARRSERPQDRTYVSLQGRAAASSVGARGLRHLNLGSHAEWPGICAASIGGCQQEEDPAGPGDAADLWLTGQGDQAGGPHHSPGLSHSSVTTVGQRTIFRIATEPRRVMPPGGHSHTHTRVHGIVQPPQNCNATSAP